MFFRALKEFYEKFFVHNLAIICHNSERQERVIYVLQDDSFNNYLNVINIYIQSRELGDDLDSPDQNMGDGLFMFNKEIDKIGYTEFLKEFV